MIASRRTLGLPASTLADSRGVTNEGLIFNGSAFVAGNPGPRAVRLGNRSTDYVLAVTGDEEALLTMTATGAFAVSFTGAAAGTTVTLEITQDGTGSRVVTLPTLNVTYPLGAFALSTAGGSVDIITFYTPDGTNWRAWKAGSTLALGYTSTTAAAGNDPRLVSTPRPPKAWGGLLAWTFEPELFSTTFAVATTLEYIHKVWLPTPCTITNIVTYYQTVGGSPTSGQCFAAIKDSSGNVLRATNDFSAAASGAGLITSLGLQTIPLSSPYSWAGGADAYLYVSVMINAGTTPKLMIRGMNGDSAWTNLNCPASAPNSAFKTAQTAITSGAPSGYTINNLFYWLALS